MSCSGPQTGGRLAFHDVFQGEGGAPYIPAPWADHPSFCFLVAPEEIAGTLEEHGFGVVQRRNTTDLSAKWFAQAVENTRRNGRPLLGVHVLMRADSDAKLVNMVRNLIEHRIVVMQAVWQKEMISPRSAIDRGPAEDRR